MLGMVVLNPNWADDRGRRIAVQGWPGKKHEPLFKNKTEAKRVGGMAQVVEDLPSKCETLSSNSVLSRKNIF
jgi:hypothetical protein